MARIYAEDTKVPVLKSKGQIEALVKQHGATSFGIMEMNGQAQVVFAMNNRNLLFKVQIPEEAKEERARWRALLLCIKSKLISWEGGIETFEEAFLSQTVMPNGQTAAEATLPAIERYYTSGEYDVPLIPDMRK